MNEQVRKLYIYHFKGQKDILDVEKRNNEYRIWIWEKAYATCYMLMPKDNE